MVITQNIDGLHKRAGSENIIELHGNLFKVRCTKCKAVTVNKDSPICESLRGRGAPEPEAKSDRIPIEMLPRCPKEGCGGLLRPHVVWFGEGLDERVLRDTDENLDSCDLCLVVGTSSVVYPAAMFAPGVCIHFLAINILLSFNFCLIKVAARGVPVAEFNLECTPATQRFAKNGFFFEGPCGQILPTALA